MFHFCLKRNIVPPHAGKKRIGVLGLFCSLLLFADLMMALKRIATLFLYSNDKGFLVQTLSFLHCITKQMSVMFMNVQHCHLLLHWCYSG